MKQEGYQIKHKVKLWSVDILKYFKFYKKIPFTIKDVAEQFNITSKEAYKRVNRLRQWGLVKIKSRKKPKTYEITIWGEQFQSRREKE